MFFEHVYSFLEGWFINFSIYLFLNACALVRITKLIFNLNVASIHSTLGSLARRLGHQWRPPYLLSTPPLLPRSSLIPIDYPVDNSLHPFTLPAPSNRISSAAPQLATTTTWSATAAEPLPFLRPSAMEIPSP